MTFNFTTKVTVVTYTDTKGSVVKSPCVSIRKNVTSINPNESLFIEYDANSCPTGRFNISVSATNCEFNIVQINVFTFELYLSNVIGDVVITFTGTQP